MTTRAVSNRTYDNVPDDCPLTARQLEIARLKARGIPARRIAAQCHVTPSAVRGHLNRAYERLGLHGDAGCDRGNRLLRVMVARGWMDADALLPDDDGAVYAIVDQRGKHDALPSPEQWLYCDAFDRLCRERTVEAAVRLDIYFKVMCMTRNVADRRQSGSETRQLRRVPARDIDEMLLRLGTALTRRIPEPQALDLLDAA